MRKDFWKTMKEGRDTSRLTCSLPNREIFCSINLQRRFLKADKP